MYFYLSKSGETRGPISFIALKVLLKAHTPDVTEETLVWREGIEWTPFKILLQQEEDVSASYSNNNQQEHLQQLYDTSYQEEEEEEEIEEDEGNRFGIQKQQQQQNSGNKQQSHKKKTESKGKHQSSSVYVQGLPLNVTEEEVSRYFSKCGVLKKENNKDKIKLYRDPNTNQLKGDALITYVVPDSVQLAIQQLDNFEFRDGHVLNIKEAEFSRTDNNNNNGSSKTDQKLIRAKKVRRMQERSLLSWNEESYVTKESALLIVVLKGMFLPEELSKSNNAITELEKDLIEGLENICPTGQEIKKITIFKSHPEGIILIRFKDAVIASECVSLMNGRYFDGRKIEAALWDGVTEYAPRESAEDRANDEVKRMKEYQEWLENQEA